MSLSLLHSFQLTAEKRILIAVVSTVVVAVTEVFREDADVGAFTLDLARRTCPVSWKGLKRAKIKTSTTGSKHKTSVSHSLSFSKTESHLEGGYCNC